MSVGLPQWFYRALAACFVLTTEFFKKEDFAMKENYAVIWI
jgi:hypothetical protein